MSALKKLYEGKAKILYQTEEPDILLACFKDDATAFNAQKRGEIAGKGAINCAISTHLFQRLEAAGIATHFVDSPAETLRVGDSLPSGIQPAPAEMRVQKLKIFPLEVVVRNIAAGSLCQQTGLALGTLLKQPLVEFFYKNDGLGDPLLTRDRLLLLELATSEQVEQLKNLALRINQTLTEFFRQCGITLVDFKLEFGLNRKQQLLLADEISPDTCRLWNQSEPDLNRRVMDKDRFRHDLGNVEIAYQQVLERVLAQAIQP